MAPALEGIKIVQTARIMAGPMAARLLADWGAEVIVVEPVIGDGPRDLRYQALTGKGKLTGINPEFEPFYLNKRSIALDLSREAGREILDRLLEKADVLVSNFRQREIDKFHLDYETLSRLNPRLIRANITGWGRKGPNRDHPASGFLTFCRAGVEHLLLAPGTDPVTVPLDMPDIFGGLSLAYGIALALLIREKTGVGQEVDTSLFHTMVFGISAEMTETLVTGQHRVFQTPRIDNTSALSTFYRTKDNRWFRLSVGIQRGAGFNWSDFCRAIECEELANDPRFESNEARQENKVDLFHIMEDVFLNKTLAEWTARLDELRIASAPVQNPHEVIADPQARANDFFVPFEHPEYGPMEVVASPVTLSQAQPVLKLPAPELGQHTEEILLEYGYTQEDIARFREQHVIAQG
ncbi:CaiB/BaiF CoA transferase family protein [Chloroflexota bacterium]